MSFRVDPDPEDRFVGSLRIGDSVPCIVRPLVTETIDGPIAGKHLVKRHDTERPQGVRGTNSDNTRLRDVLQWSPETTLARGLPPTYHWIEAQLTKTGS